MLIICNLQCFPDIYFLISVNEIFFYDLPNFCKTYTTIYFRCMFFHVYTWLMSWCMVRASFKVVYIQVSGEAYIWGTYIQDVSWVTYFGDIYLGVY